MRARIGVATALGALLLVGAAGAQAHNDPVGDSAGPDVRTVTLAHNEQNFTVHVQLANRTELEDDEIVQIDVDLDGSESTGDEGIDLYAVFPFDEPEVLIWQADDYVDTTRASALFRSDGAHLTVPRALVSGTVKVHVMGLGLDEQTSDQPPIEQVDNAPDTGVYEHVVGRVTLERSTVAYTPARPRAGRAFRVSNVSLVLSSGAARPTATTCSATLAGKRLRAAGACAWRIPRTARGKVLRVSIVAAVGAARYTLPARRFVVR